MNCNLKNVDGRKTRSYFHIMKKTIDSKHSNNSILSQVHCQIIPKDNKHLPPLTRAMIIGTGDHAEPFVAVEPPGVEVALDDEFPVFSIRVAATASGVSAFHIICKLDLNSHE